MATIEELKELFSTGKKPTGADFASLIDGVKGEKGDKGEKGETGNNGADGVDGFGTEAQYNGIISRLDAIEARLDALENV